jgi:hypothetical protein
MAFPVPHSNRIKIELAQGPSMKTMASMAVQSSIAHLSSVFSVFLSISFAMLVRF